MGTSNRTGEEKQLKTPQLLTENIIDLIGNTPILKLNKIAEGLPGTIYAKLEFLNPGGSIKDRIGISMIEAAEAQGLIKPGYTIVEPTSGNTGLGLSNGSHSQRLQNGLHLTRQNEQRKN